MILLDKYLLAFIGIYLKFHGGKNTYTNFALEKPFECRRFMKKLIYFKFTSI